MKSSLKLISNRLQDEFGLVAHLVLGEGAKIVGGAAYDDRDGLALYVKKFEILESGNKYHLKLSVGQTFLKRECDSAEDAVRVLIEHFDKFHPNVRLRPIKLDE